MINELNHTFDFGFTWESINFRKLLILRFKSAGAWPSIIVINLLLLTASSESLISLLNHIFKLLPLVNYT